MSGYDEIRPRCTCRPIFRDGFLNKRLFVRDLLERNIYMITSEWEYQKTGIRVTWYPSFLVSSNKIMYVYCGTCGEHLYSDDLHKMIIKYFSLYKNSSGASIDVFQKMLDAQLNYGSDYVAPYNEYVDNTSEERCGACNRLVKDCVCDSDVCIGCGCDVCVCCPECGGNKNKCGCFCNDCENLVEYCTCDDDDDEEEYN